MTLPTTTREWRNADPPSGFDALRIEEAQLAPLKANEVLVRVRAVSLQFRDLAVSQGVYPLPMKPRVVLGSDAAGEIIALGAEVTQWAVGDRVVSNFNIAHLHGEVTAAIADQALGAPIDGVLTTYRALPAQALVRVPELLSFEEASTLPCAGLTAYNALLGLHPLKGGDYVLIEGTGGVSIFALQFALASGATPIVITSSDAKAATARSLGAIHVINYNTVPDWEQVVLNMTGGIGVDHVLEVSGTKTLQKAMVCARLGAVISAIGFLSGAEPGFNVYMACLTKALILRGVLIGSRAQFEDMMRLIVANNIKPVVDKIFGFDELTDALKYLASQKHIGKVVVRVD